MPETFSAKLKCLLACTVQVQKSYTFSAKLKCLLAYYWDTVYTADTVLTTRTRVVQKSHCAMGQRLLQRPSYGCLYKGSASSARRRNRSPPAAHRTSPPSPAVTLFSVFRFQLVEKSESGERLTAPAPAFEGALSAGVGAAQTNTPAPRGRH